MGFSLVIPTPAATIPSRSANEMTSDLPNIIGLTHAMPVVSLSKSFSVSTFHVCYIVAISAFVTQNNVPKVMVLLRQ